MSTSGSLTVPAVPSSGDVTVSVGAATVAQHDNVGVDVDPAALAVIHLVSRSLCVRCVFSLSVPGRFVKSIPPRFLGPSDAYGRS